MDKNTLEKVLEYATMPVHGTLSRRLRKDVQLQLNDGPVYVDAIFDLTEVFIRIVESRDGKTINTYVGWDGVSTVRTFSAGEH